MDQEGTQLRAIAPWGFDFVRVPPCYRLWVKSREHEISASDAFHIREEALHEVDRAVRLGEQYGQHVCICVPAGMARGARSTHRNRMGQEAFSALSMTNRGKKQWGSSPVLGGRSS